jgi:XTP/dITP diphosphohydrolase
MLNIRKLVFATNNPHKIEEVKQILGNSIEVISVSEIGFTDDIPEDYETLEENASQKAWYIFNRFGLPCIADDTGLEVEALNGEPGVRSARYAGNGRTAADNITKLLEKLKREANRKARFRTVVSLVDKGQEFRFEGIVNGTIVDELMGSSGFGYDPIFIPDGHKQTFAQMPSDLKNSISHRGRAIEKLSKFLFEEKV